MIIFGFPCGIVVKNLPAMQEIQVQFLGREGPLEKEWLPTPVFLPGEFHEQNSLDGYSLWGRRVDSTEHTHTHKDNIIDNKYNIEIIIKDNLANK